VGTGTSRESHCSTEKLTRLHRRVDTSARICASCHLVDSERDDAMGDKVGSVQPNCDVAEPQLVERAQLDVELPVRPNPRSHAVSRRGQYDLGHRPPPPISGTRTACAAPKSCSCQC